MKYAVNASAFEREIIALASTWAASQRVALVTLINIEGNAPYPVGAQMLVAESGQFAGQITGGCAEQAIADHAVVAIKEQVNGQERYGLDSRYFDIQLPCGSGIDVYFETGLDASEYLDMANRLAAREVIEWEIDAELGCFKKTFLPTPILVVAGQGPIVQALAKLAQLSGFAILIIAQNDATLDQCESAGLTAHRLDTIDLEDLPTDPYCAFVSLFHEHDLETPLFTRLLPRNWFYFGALGSRRTQQKRCAELADNGVPAALIKKIHGPVGLNIGANTPEQIAVSTLAHVIQVHNLLLSSESTNQLEPIQGVKVDKAS